MRHIFSALFFIFVGFTLGFYVASFYEVPSEKLSFYTYIFGAITATLFFLWMFSLFPRKRKMEEGDHSAPTEEKET